MQIVKKIQQPGFLHINKTNFKGLFIIIDFAMAAHLDQLNSKKTEVCVGDLLAAIFGDQRIEGFREKCEWNTGIKKCVQPLKA